MRDSERLRAACMSEHCASSALVAWPGCKRVRVGRSSRSCGRMKHLSRKPCGSPAADNEQGIRKPTKPASRHDHDAVTLRQLAALRALCSFGQSAASTLC
eukprot:Amastigsp_a167_453.p4 type:complete len:100 gc:universal Amastigsp_a167_453:472-173(-)